MTPHGAGRRRSPLYALLTANGISGFGNEMAAVAIPWFVLLTTGSAARTGIVAAAMLFPFIMATFFGGIVIDRVGFTQISIVADITSGVTVALIPLLHLTVGLPFSVLLVLVFLGALLDAPGATARQSMIPDVSETAGLTLERANSVFESVQQFKNLLGPLAAGLLIVSVGASSVLWIDGATFAASAAIIALGVPRTVRATAPVARSARATLGEAFEGLRFIRGNRPILGMSLVSLVGNFTLAPVFLVIMPVYATDVLGSAARLGVVIAAFGAGALVSSIAYGTLAHRVPRRIWYISATAGVPIGFTILTFGPETLGATAALLAMGVTSGAGRPLGATVRQERTPLHLRGRVFGAIIAVSNSATPAGVLVAGLLISQTSLQTTLVCCAAVSIATLVTVILHPAFAELERPAA